MIKTVWANLLHIYQPPGWDQKIIKKVARESYLPVFRILKKRPQIKITLNINGSLTEQLSEHGLTEIIGLIKLLAKRRQIEFTGSAIYHTILPKLPTSEIQRQIQLNTKINQKYFGNLYRPSGFFPPEMCYNNKVAKVLVREKFSWIALDEIAYRGKSSSVDWRNGYRIKGTQLKVAFRNHNMSDLFTVKPQTETKKLFRATCCTGEPLFTAFDGETLGHHRPGMEKVFEELTLDKKIQTETYSQALEQYSSFKSITPIPSSWASSEKELKNSIPFELWDHPKNPIHKLQWQLFNLVLSTIKEATHDKNFTTARAKLDKSMSSDFFWWASAHPWWSVEIIEEGANRLTDLIDTLDAPPISKQKRVRLLAEQIKKLAHQWQYSGRAKKEKKMFLAGYNYKPYMAGKKEN
jgi:alpha-amylase/alpha-mannosidase (GH57 family)